MHKVLCGGHKCAAFSDATAQKALTVPGGEPHACLSVPASGEHGSEREESILHTAWEVAKYSLSS